MAYLLYENDYERVLLDALSIIMDYYGDYSFNPEKLHAIDYHIEGCVGRTYPPEHFREYLSGEHGHGVSFFVKKAPLKNWTKDSKRKFFIISDIHNCLRYEITL